MPSSRQHIFEVYGLQLQPGPLPFGLPAPLSQANVPTICGEQLQQYVVGPKANGDREMVVAWDKDLFAVNRMGKGRKLNWLVADVVRLGTLLDVETVSTDYGRVCWILDCVELCGHNLRHQPYHFRMAAAIRFLSTLLLQGRPFPWTVAAEGTAWTNGQFFTLIPNYTLAVKPCWYVSVAHLERLLQWTRAMSAYLPVDGDEHQEVSLFFTPVQRSVATFRAPQLLKWKPPYFCTVDFLVQHVTESTGLIDLLVMDEKDVLVRYARTSLRSDIEGPVQSDVIYECRWDVQNHQWILHRRRTDKIIPNSRDAADSIGTTIAENLTWHKLCRLVALSTGEALDNK